VLGHRKYEKGKLENPRHRGNAVKKKKKVKKVMVWDEKFLFSKVYSYLVSVGGGREGSP